jgi:hypothetical protein
MVDRHFIAWIGGLVAGSAMALWVSLRDTPPSYIEHWRDGAEGERKTEKVLRPLERADWRVFHDVDNGHGNYDHIVVSRAGVFLMETKNLLGVVEIREGVPHLQRRLDPENNSYWPSIPKSALRSAATLKLDIEQRTGHRTWVQAVVVFWADFPEGLVENGKCIFIHGSRLREWMRERPERLSEGVAEEIADCVTSIGNRELAEDAATVSPGLSPA